MRAEVDLGPCCGCGTRDGVVNIVMLPHKAPEPGKGWGCAICNLPPDGAVAVYCGACLDADNPDVVVCAGYPSEGRRVSFAEIAHTVHDHDPEVDHG